MVIYGCQIREVKKNMTKTFEQEVWVSPEALQNNYNLEANIRFCDTIEELSQVVADYSLICYEELGYMHVTDEWEHDDFQLVGKIENYTWDNDVEDEE